MKQLIGIIKNIFNRLDSRLLGHGERVAYIVYKILKKENMYSESEIKDATVLALLHDIGALKTDEIDNMISFDSNNTFHHCIYGYLFIKYFSPLSDKSEIILYHHTKYFDYNNDISEYKKDISSLIYLVDRIDIWNISQKNNKLFDNNKGYFNDKYYKLFIKMNSNNELINEINNDTYKEHINEIDELFSINEVRKYLEMLVFAIDFRSYQTVTHSLLVGLFAIDLGKRLGLSHYKINQLYYSSLLHDVGKISTPSEILEKDGKLNDEEMTVMRHHVVVSEDIIKPYVNKRIMFPAIRHHERLDGSGYPKGLHSNELSIEDNIIIIADVLSALIMKRSYKQSFSKEITLSILSDLKNKNKIDKNIYNVLSDNYDEIIEKASKKIRFQEERFVAIMKEYDLFIKNK